MTGFIAYETRDGERWDTIAMIAYGNPYAYEQIIRANPQVPIRPVLPGGLILQIPVLPKAAAHPAGLPPWKDAP
jgi:hypothetical protein